MQSQLGMITPFFHKAPCGGSIKQALAPEQTRAYAMTHTPALKYKCIGCNEFVEPEDVVEKAGDWKKGEKPEVKAKVPPATSTSQPPQQQGPPPAQPAPVAPTADATKVST